jgi:tetratricopeptide (TPR) repeat protein
LLALASLELEVGNNLSAQDVALWMNRLAEAKQYLDGAQPLVTKFPDEPRLRGQLEIVKAKLTDANTDATAAEAGYKRALSWFTEATGARSPHVASAHRELGNFYLKQHRYNDADIELELAREIYADRYGEQSLENAIVLRLLATVRHGQDRPADGVLLNEKALATLVASMGEDNATLAGIYIEQGHLLEEANRLDEAIAMMTKGAELTAKRYGTDSREYGVDLAEVGWLQQRANKLDDAFATLQRVLAMLETSPDPNAKMESIPMLTVLGDVERRRGRLAEAATLAQRAVERARGLLPPNEWLLAGALTGLGQIERERKRLPASRDLLEEALRMRLANKDSIDDLGITRFELARTLLELGVRPRAFTLAREALADLEAIDKVRAAEIQAWLAQHAR